MKIDRSKLKKGNFDVPHECKTLISRIGNCKGKLDLLNELKNIKSWVYGKCELLNWVDVLDKMDEVLEAACQPAVSDSRALPGCPWPMACDLRTSLDAELDRDLLLATLHFSALLIEHSFTRHLYSSMEHLTMLLASSDMTIVMAVVDVLYVFSKRSNFISRLPAEKKQALITRLVLLAETWGGKENGFGLASCAQDLPLTSYPDSATTLHFEYYDEGEDHSSKKPASCHQLRQIHVPRLDKLGKDASSLMVSFLKNSKLAKDKEMQLFTHIRLALSFSNYEKRLQCVQARLQAISTLIYSNAAQDHLGSLLYSGFVEELVDLLELKNDKLTELKATSLRTLTAVVHFEGNRKLNSIIDATGTSSYHGFLPTLMRQCIQNIIDPENPSFPQSLTTALFSFLYHLASYESGGEALVSCGIMESLIKVISWHGDDSQDHITFVTRAVRVVDLVMSLDMQAFQSYGAMNEFINRLQHEVDICRKEQPFVFRVRTSSEFSDSFSSSPRYVSGDVSMAMDTEKQVVMSDEMQGTSIQEQEIHQSNSTFQDISRQCFPQRVALLKSILNFIKKAISETSFSDTIRHLMDGSLPCSLKHIISNAEYYGPSLFLLATELVTVYVFQEPSMLSSLQSNGLTDVMLQALLVKNVPATKEVLSALPNVFSALCLNSRGLDAFMACNPFENLFKVLLSPDYLPAMKRRRSSDLPGDTATSLGSAVDELMRHQPSLRSEAINGIVCLLDRLKTMGMDPDIVCHQRPSVYSMLTAQASSSSSTTGPQGGGQSSQSNNNLGNSSDDDDDDDDVASVHSIAAGTVATTPEGSSSEGNVLPGTKATATEGRLDGCMNKGKKVMPLVDYVLNVMKFTEAILSNNTTDDHCREFVSQRGLDPLLNILVLPNLPSDFPSSTSCQAVASVCKSILTLTHDPQVLINALRLANSLLIEVQPINTFLEAPGASVLLKEMTDALLSGVPDPALEPKATPLLHSLKAIHSIVIVFITICKANQNDIRNLSLNQWGSPLGLEVLKGLSKLYQSLVWESSVMVNLCTDSCILHLPTAVGSGEKPCEEVFGIEEVRRIMEHLSREDRALFRCPDEEGPVPMDLSSEGTADANTDMEVEATTMPNVSNAPTKDPCRHCYTRTVLIKSVLLVASKLGRSLTELFVLLVRVSVGSPVRPRRNQQNYQAASIMVAPLPVGRAVASHFAQLMNSSLSWFPPPHSPVWKRRLTYLMCSIAFTSSMVFDDKKQPYHLMLQKFISNKCHQSLYESFHWVMTKGNSVSDSHSRGINSEFPGGSIEFVDVWLMLVEKLVNPKNILESPYNMPTVSSQTNYKPFDPLQYLAQMQQMAFQALSLIWDKQFVSVRMAESSLNILCHIINCENVFKKKKKGSVENQTSSEGATQAGSQTSSGEVATGNNAEENMAFRLSEESINSNHLQQLMDMGFTRAQSIEALLNSNGLEQATEYCLFHPPPAEMSETNEDDQMVQAIAMSLNENDTQEQASNPPNGTESVSSQQPVQAAQEEISSSSSMLPIGPVSKEMLDEFLKSILWKCMESVDVHGEVVYKVTDVFALLSERNGLAWLDKMLNEVVTEIRSMCTHLIEKSQPMTIGDTRSILDWANGLSEAPHAQRLAARLHFLSLLFESQKVSCAKILESTGLLDLLVRLMHCTQHCIGVAKGSNTPKWVAPMMLLIDLYEKMSVSTKRRHQLISIIGSTHTWKWFDDRSGRWSSYGPSNNKTIDDAYWAGQTSIRFTAGRRRYLVQFNTMIQVNEETGNRRPIMLHIPTKDDQSTDSGSLIAGEEVSASRKGYVSEEPNKREINEYSCGVVCGLLPEQGVNLIRSCVGFIGAKVDPNTLHACLRLTLRLTRELKYSSIFVEMNGPQLLLALPTDSSFQGFLSLATLILRHTIEDERALTYAMEKIIRSSTLGTGSSACGVAMNSNGSRELHYVMRVLSPAICRDKEIFTTVANKVLRIQVPVLKKDDGVFNPSNPQLVKCNFPDPRHKMPPLGDVAKEVIQVMLRALATSNHSMATTVPSNMTGNSTSMNMENTDGSKIDEKKKKLIPKSAIMRLLAELVRSYVGCASYIATQSFHANETDLVVEDCSVLSFILDNLMYKDHLDNSDPHLPALSRLLLASIAASNHSPDAQNILAIELKGALQRSLSMPECADKHNRVQTISQLIATVIQACPVYTQKVSLLDSQTSSNLNNMVKVLIKRGLVSDLARVPHSLDLSSPYMALTVNAALKPLETLSRIVNQPQSSTTSATSAQKTRHHLMTRPEHIRSALDSGGAGMTDGQSQIDARQDGDIQESGERLDLGSGVSALREAYGDDDDEDDEEDDERSRAEVDNLAADIEATDASMGGNRDADNRDDLDHVTGNNNMEGSGDRFFETVNDLDLDEDDDDSTDIDDIDDMVDDEDDDVVDRSGNEDGGGQDERSSRRQQQSTLDAVLDTLLDRGSGGNPDVIGDIITMSVERPGETEDTVEIDIEVATTGNNRDPQVVIQRISDNEDDDEVDEENPANNQDEHDNEQWEGDLDEDGEDEDNEDDEEGDEDDDDDVDDDDDERSVIDGEEDDDFVGETEESQRNNDYDELLSQWEDMLPSSGMMLESSGPVRTYLPISIQGSEAATDTGTSIPPAPSGVMVNHPLLVRTQDSTQRDASGSQGGNNAGSSAAGGSRLHRTSRSRNTFRYNPNTQTLHVQYTRSRHVNPPAILQRLLGSSSDVMHISNSLGSGGSTRLHLLSNDELRVVTRAGAGGGGGDESLLESLFQGDFLNDDDSSSLGLLTDIPAALSRWAEEAKVLDGEIGMFETMSVVKREVLIELERIRDAQIVEMREKRAKEKQTTNAMAEENKNGANEKPGKIKSENQAETIEKEENIEAVAEDYSSISSSDTQQQQQQQQSYDQSSATVASEEGTASGSVVDLPTLQSVLTELNDLAVVRDPLMLEAEVLALTRRDASASARNFPSDVDAIPEESGQRPALDGNTRILVTFAEDMPTSLQAAAVASVASLSSDADNSSSLSEPMSGVTISRETPLDMSHTAEVEEAAGGYVPIEEEEEEHATSIGDRVVVVTTDASSALAGEASIVAPLEGNPSTSNGEGANNANMFGDIILPEGVDPSFLAALPENIRQEVIAEQLRLQRIQQRAQQQQMEAQTLGISEVNPEFLAALPPNIQEEVLAQQRVEQSRLTQNPDTPTDPASFIQSLPPTLRQQVLADMDDSMLAVLPADLAAEANVLRRELEDRHRMLLQERLFTQGGVLSGILRHPGYSSRTLQGNSYSLRPSNAVALRSSHWSHNNSREGRGASGASQAAVAALKIRGRHLLDNEALACLLVLLFVDEPRLNTTRLHRVVRNLSYHAPTRAWIVDSLLSVLQRTNEQLHSEENELRLKEKWMKKRIHPQEMSNESWISHQGDDNQSIAPDPPSWLNIYLCAALGSQTNVFKISRVTTRPHSSRSSCSISIHPQACAIICRHVLDILISLAKTFPTHFLPQQNQTSIGEILASDLDSPLKSKARDGPSSQGSTNLGTGKPDFWESLMKLDNALSGKKGKSSQKEKAFIPTTSGAQQAESSGNIGSAEQTTFESSPLGQLMSTLSHPVIRRSQMLTDRLLRVLKLISIGLFDNTSKPITTSSSATTPTASNANITGPSIGSNTTSATSAEESKTKQNVETAPSFSFCIDLENSTVLENQLKLLVEILISKHCSEEGFEDATSLLLQLAKSDSFLCETILKLLIKGAHQLGGTVCNHIKKLSDELDAVVPIDISPKEEEDVNSLLSGPSNQKGILQDRFGGGNIVVHAPTSSKFKGRGRELQLPSMQLLTNKGSSQNFLLRVLKIIILLRGPMKSILKKNCTSLNQNSVDAPSSAPGISREQGDLSSTPMEVENSGNPSGASSNSWPNMPHMTEFIHLDELWNTLGGCLLKLAMMPDNHAVLVLQPAVEAFFFVHAGKRDQSKKENSQSRREDQSAHVAQYNPSMSPSTHQSDQTKLEQLGQSKTVVRPETQRFISFAETHRTVLNQILRQSTVPLADGPFSVLVDYTRVLDFDVKRRYFRQELDRVDDGLRKEDLAVHVRRDNVFEDSFRELHRRNPDEWKNRFYIVFEGEEGQDAGGLLREWYIIISREIFNPNYALFCTSPGDRVTYTINTSSHCNSNHLSYFKFVGRIIAKAIYDNKLLECYFTRSFYKHILGVPVKYTDMESEDYDFYKGLVFLLENNVEDLGYDLTFSTEIQEFGVTTIRDLKEDGRNVRVTEENKKEYVKLVCQMKMTGAIKQQLTAFLDGFYSIIPKRLISIFNEQELELLISGLPSIDIDDLKSNTEIHKYQANALQIQWFWRALRSFDQADRARFLQFVTGTSKVPLQGFAYLEGMNGIQKFQIHKDDRSTDRLPSAHTCFNQLDLPIYETYDKLKRMLLLAIHECSEGFGLA